MDGDTHVDVTYDAKRQSFIEAFGIRFIRFTNAEVYQDLDSVMEMITQTAMQISQEHNLPCLSL
jgi:very-short-patch-repair endonuclease